VERETGFEPATPCLEGRNSTAELLPHRREVLPSVAKSVAKYLERFQKPKTREYYRLILGKFLGTPLEATAIQSWLDSLPCGNARHNYYRGIRAFIRWLWKNGEIPEDVTAKVTPPKVTKKLLPAISKDKLKVLLDSVTCERDRVVIQLLWCTGARLSEVAGIKSGDFNWDKGTVIVYGSKTETYRQVIVEGDNIKSWFSQHDSLEVTASGIQTMLARLGKATGVHCNPHSWRRGRTVSLLLAGFSNKIVQSLIGWESPDMVTKYAASLSFDDALAVYLNGNSHR